MGEVNAAFAEGCRKITENSLPLSLVMLFAMAAFVLPELFRMWRRRVSRLSKVSNTSPAVRCPMTVRFPSARTPALRSPSLGDFLSVWFSVKNILPQGLLLVLFMCPSSFYN